MQRDVMTYDILIVGAGPAGLSAAIKLKQLANSTGRELSVCVLEKGAEVIPGSSSACQSSAERISANWVCLW